MKRLRAWMFRLAGMFPNQRREAELAAEIESHLQMHIDDNLRTGMTPEQARRHAILKLGGVEPTKEAYRDRGAVPLVEHLLQDIRFAIRQLQKNPGFTCTAILMLALGMGASVAIFAFVDAALIKPLPYLNPTRLAGVYESIPLCSQCNLSYPDYLDWKKLNEVFTSLDVYQDSGFTVSTAEGAEQAGGARVTAGFFRTLGIAPALGRDFNSGEDLPAAPRTVIISYAAWQKRYGGRRDVLGQTVTLNGDPNIIIGVLPRDFHFAPAEPAEFWTALHATTGCYQRRSCHSLLGVARLKDGVPVEKALANMKAIAQQLESQYPDSNRGQGANVIGLTEAIIGDVRPILLVLLSGAGLLLLIASVNVASLLLVRSESRKREIAVRSALGGSAARLFSQFMTESLVLVAAGSVLGLLSANWLMELLIRLLPEGMLAGMPYLHGLGLSAHVLVFAAGISLFAAALFSITPALRLSLPDIRDGLAEGSRGSAGTAWRRFGAKLVVLELATAVVLLVGAGLLGQSLNRLLHVDIGFEPNHLATLRLGAPPSRYSSKEQIIALERRVLSQIASLPGVQFAGISSKLPLIGGNTMWIRVVGRPYHGEHNEVSQREVSASYFTTLRARLLRGRYFTEEEDASKPPVVIIDRALANKYFPGENPVGKQILYAPSSSTPPMEVVGVVDDIKEGQVDKENWPTMYVPFNQDPGTSFSVAVRTSQTAQSLLPSLAGAIHQIDPGISTFDQRTMSQRINDSPAAYLRRASAWLVGGFAVLALLLSVVGLYGVVAYSVSRRTREIGVRMALGAQRGAVYRLILNEAGRLTAAGIVIGLVCSVAAATLMRGLLFHVESWDVPTLAAVAAALGISALLASYIPARRAASVNPVDALRAE
jgi:macrolide transport system ATP-binding/permease protein